MQKKRIIRTEIGEKQGRRKTEEKKEERREKKKKRIIRRTEIGDREK